MDPNASSRVQPGVFRPIKPTATGRGSGSTLQGPGCVAPSCSGPQILKILENLPLPRIAGCTSYIGELFASSTFPPCSCSRTGAARPLLQRAQNILTGSQIWDLSVSKVFHKLYQKVLDHELRRISSTSPSTVGASILSHIMILYSIELYSSRSLKYPQDGSDQSRPV